MRELKDPKGNWTVSRGRVGQCYTVPRLVFDECPACGEQVFSPEAMAKIELYSEAATTAIAAGA